MRRGMADCYSGSAQTTSHSQRILSRDVAQHGSAGFDRSSLRDPVHRNDTELRIKAGHPFEVIQQRPGNVAAYIHAIVDGTLQTGQSPLHIFHAPAVVLSGNSVFRDYDGNTRLLAGIANHMLNAFRIEL